MPMSGSILYSMNDQNTCMELRYRSSCCGGRRNILTKKDGQEIKIDANRCFPTIKAALSAELDKWITNRTTLTAQKSQRNNATFDRRLATVNSLIEDLNRQLSYCK